MLHYKEYVKVNNQSKISEMKKEIERLQMIGEVSRDLTMYLEAVENVENVDIVNSIHTHSNGGCLVELKDSTKSWDTYNDFLISTGFEKMPNSIKLFEALKNIWNMQSDRTKEKVSIAFSGDKDSISTIQVFWRGSLITKNDIALITEENVKA